MYQILPIKSESHRVKIQGTLLAEIVMVRKSCEVTNFISLKSAT